MTSKLSEYPFLELRHRGSLAMVAALLVLSGAGCADAEPGAGPGADSPQALLAAAREAGAERDVSALVRLVAPSQLHLLAMETDMAADFMSELAEGDEAGNLAEELARLRDRYGIDSTANDDQPMLEIGPETQQAEIDAHIDARARRIYENVDLIGYVGELSALLVSTSAMAAQPLFPAGEIGDIEADGDRVIVRIGDQEIELLREAGRSFLARLGS